MSVSGSTTTKPVPVPRRGRKTKEPSASDKLQNVQLQFQNAVRPFYEWMDKLGKCVSCAYQKRRNVTKVGRPTRSPSNGRTEKPTFCYPRGWIIFLHKSLLSVRNKGCQIPLAVEKSYLNLKRHAIFKRTDKIHHCGFVVYFQIFKCKIPERVLLNGAICKRFSKVSCR